MNATIRLGLSSVLLMCAGGLAAYAPAASAQVAPLIKNTGNGRCLAATVASGAAVTQICSGAAINPQLWTQINIAPGVFLLRNNGTGKCLDNNAAGGVFTSGCNSAIATQRWQRQNASATTARYRSIGTGLFLTSTGPGAVFSGPFSANPLQIWAY